MPTLELKNVSYAYEKAYLEKDRDLAELLILHSTQRWRWLPLMYSICQLR